jgi:hypothetical protein
MTWHATLQALLIAIALWLLVNGLRSSKLGEIIHGKKL